MNTVFVAQKVDPAAPQTPGRAWPAVPCTRHPLSGTELANMAYVLQENGVTRLSALRERVRQFSPLNGAPVSGQVYTDNYAPVDIAQGW